MSARAVCRAAAQRRATASSRPLAPGRSCQEVAAVHEPSGASLVARLNASPAGQQPIGGTVRPSRSCDRMRSQFGRTVLRPAMPAPFERAWPLVRHAGHCSPVAQTAPQGRGHAYGLYSGHNSKSTPVRPTSASARPRNEQERRSNHSRRDHATAPLTLFRRSRFGAVTLHDTTTSLIN